MSSCDQSSVNYSVHSLYKCIDLTTTECLPQLPYDSDQQNNVCGPVVSSRHCWSQFSEYEMMSSQLNLMNIFMRSKVKSPVQYCANHLTNDMAMNCSKQSSLSMPTDDNKNKVWFTKFKRQRPKRFSCPHCQIAFSNNGQLVGHIRTHTGIYI